MKKIIFTDKAQQPGGMPYSQAVKVGNTSCQNNRSGNKYGVHGPD